jgi:hypothetical protein
MYLPLAVNLLNVTDQSHPVKSFYGSVHVEPCGCFFRMIATTGVSNACPHASGARHVPWNGPSRLCSIRGIIRSVSALITERSGPTHSCSCLFIHSFSSVVVRAHSCIHQIQSGLDTYDPYLCASRVTSRNVFPTRIRGGDCRGNTHNDVDNHRGITVRLFDVNAVWPETNAHEQLLLQVFPYGIRQRQRSSHVCRSCESGLYLLHYNAYKIQVVTWGNFVVNFYQDETSS